jgi:thymidylate synthase
MNYMKVSDIRDYFKSELASERFTLDKTGQKTIEMLGASFIADEPSIFGEPNQAYIKQELDWYESQSTNINDIYGEERDAPAAWKYAADAHGNINSNYGKLVFSKEYFKQYLNATAELINNPDTRRATMVYTRPSIWAEFDKGGMSDFICTNAVTYYIRDGLLHSVVQMRSNDVVFGYKNDYAWQRYMMDKVVDSYNEQNPFDDISVGTLYWQVQNLHVYDRHFGLVE